MTVEKDQDIFKLGSDFAALGRIIRKHRKRSGLSRQALADIAGIGKTAVFEVEHGKPTVKLSTLLPMLNALNIEIALTSPLMAEYTKRETPCDVLS